MSSVFFHLNLCRLSRLYSVWFTVFPQGYMPVIMAFMISCDDWIVMLKVIVSFWYALVLSTHGFEKIMLSPSVLFCLDSIWMNAWVAVSGYRWLSRGFV